jgi:hypothetical protein
MSRRLLIVAALCAVLTGAGFGTYSLFFRGEPPPQAPTFNDNPQTPLAQTDEFEKLAHEDPIAMLGQCLSRYTREVKSGIHFTLEKQERVHGKPKHPEAPPVEVIEARVRGDVPDPQTHKTAIEVMMKWKSGAKSALGSEIRGTLFSEKPGPEGLDGKVRTWRPEAIAFKLSIPLPPNSEPAQEQSRYCIRDAGLYRSMLRTHEAWKARQAAGELKIEYLGKKAPPQIGRECYVIKRTCPRVEMDAFEVGGTASTDPKVVAAEGFTEVTIYIDAERWLQVGTELYRTEPDGTHVLVGAYYFRDVQLNFSFPSDAFTTEALKR